MKKLVATLFFGLAVVTSTNAQLWHLRPRIPSLGLDTLAGEVTVYYHKGNLDHARRVQSILEGFRALLLDSLSVSSDDDAVLLAPEDWDKVDDLFPGQGEGSCFPTADDLFVCYTPPEAAFIYTYVYRDRLAAASGAAGDSLDSIASRLGFASRDSIAYWLYDLAPVHEVGHTASQEFFGGWPGGPAPDHHHKWLNEISADMLLYAFVTRFSPELRPLYRASLMARMEASSTPPEDRSGMEQLEQCDSAYAEIWEDWSMGWCWNWWALKGTEVFDELGFQFFRDLDELVPWPDAAHPYPSVEEMLMALEEMEGGWVVWLRSGSSERALPERFTLGQNYPNPFNPITTIPYSLERASRVSLVVHDVFGRRVRVLVDGMQPPGSHVVTFDGGSLPSGAYLYRMKGRDFFEVRPMLLLR